MDRLVAPLHRSDLASIAVFRALQVGDMLCAVPALRALRAAQPQARIILVGLPWAQQLAQRYSAYIDEFIAFPGHPGLGEQAVNLQQLASFYAVMRAHTLDLAIQIHGCGPASNEVVGQFGAAIHAGFVGAVPSRFDPPDWALPYPNDGPEPLRLLKLMHYLGADPSAPPELEFPITAADEDELAASGLASGLIPGGYACIHPGARLRNKCWPLDCFALVAHQLAEDFGLDIVLTGSEAERDLTTDLARRIRRPVRNAATSLSLGAMAALMRRSRLLLCNDTGVSHIAAGLNLPSVVVFSVADITRWAPLNHQLHRCVWDPKGERAELVLEAACDLLSHGPSSSSA